MMKVLSAVYPYRSWSGQILWDSQELRASSIRDTKAAGIARMRIRTASPILPISDLSGGNQQKAVIAKMLAPSTRSTG